MIPTAVAILNSFDLVKQPNEDFGYYSFKFGDNHEFELAFEPLMQDGQMYVALYRNGELLLNDKVVVKAGK